MRALFIGSKVDGFRNSRPRLINGLDDDWTRSGEIGKKRVDLMPWPLIVAWKEKKLDPRHFWTISIQLKKENKIN